MYRLESLVSFLIVVVLVILSIKAASPPSLKNTPVADSAFSVSRAFTHLKEICKAPRNTGTIENLRVRSYITNTCKQYGFEVSVQKAAVVDNFRNAVFRGANIYNIVAIKKGMRPGKALMLMAHYDTQPNTVGAGDDGVGVVSLLETARAIGKGSPLQNDLVLLFTDGEEAGLLGARAFVAEHPLFKNVGTVINFEGRGSAGPANMFEVNDSNGWAISNYALGAPYPFGNSLGYEIYKKLPNATDYTIFKEAGITGLNNAHIEDFVNYHSPNDKPDQLDLRTLQHHGINMLGFAKHFGNLSLINTKAPNRTYFNFIGYWFIHYPAAYNIVIVVIVNLLFVWYLFIGFKQRNISLLPSFFSAISLPVVMAIIYFFVKYLLKGVLSRYPLYTHFNQNNAYNCNWYFLSIAALTSAIFTIFYGILARKIRFHSMFAGIGLVLIFLMNLLQYQLPSASYLLTLPLLFLFSIQLIRLYNNNKQGKNGRRMALYDLLSVVPAIFIIATIIYFLFVAFGLGDNIPFVGMAVVLSYTMLLPVLYPLLKKLPLFIPVFSIAGLLIALFGGHKAASFNAQHPLPVNIGYRLNADSVNAHWISGFYKTDNWSQQFLNNGISGRPFYYDRAHEGNAPAIELKGPLAFLTTDSIISNERFLVVHVQPARVGVIATGIYIEDNGKVQLKAVQGKKQDIKEDNYFRNIIFEGIDTAGIDLAFTLPISQHLNITITDRSMGLPAIKGFKTSYPDSIIAGNGINNNTTQVSRHFLF